MLDKLIEVMMDKLIEVMQRECPGVPLDKLAEEFFDRSIRKKKLAVLKAVVISCFLCIPDGSIAINVLEAKFPVAEHAEYLKSIKDPLLAMLQKVAAGCEESEILEAGQNFFDQFRKADLRPGVAKLSSQVIPDDQGLFLSGTVTRHWTTEFVGKSDELLINTLKAYENDFECANALTKYYSKLVMLIQSSGAGKSRLADAVGERCTMITYVIRDHPGGYPLADLEILTFLRAKYSTSQMEKMSPRRKPDEYAESLHRVDNIWAHATMIALLQATFELLPEFIKGKFKSARSQEDLASKMHLKLAPSSEGMRSLHRWELYNEVALRAKNIRQQCIEEKGFRNCFEFVSKSKTRTSLQNSGCDAMENLRDSIMKLKRTLADFPNSHPNLPLFIIAFDEVASLLSEDGNNIQYIALSRILSCISKGNPFWYLFMSTESKINYLLPPDPAALNPMLPLSHRPSSRGEFTLNRFPPFTTFACDIPDLKKNSTLYPKIESMSDFASTDFMARFGRPLWLAFEEPHMVALEKILGTKQSKRFSPHDSQEVFAVLSNRLYLDFNMANPITLPLAQDAVNLYMRDVISIDPSTGVLYTRTPNEPILAYASMQHLCSDMSIWPIAIETFTHKLLDRGAVEKGEEGELFSRLIITLSHDRLIMPRIVDHTFQSAHLTFKVRDFLRELYTGDYHQEIDAIEKDILDAHMNFLSFSSTAEYITGDSLKSLCYTLLRRSTALQLAPQQSTYDQLLPFYTGNLDEPFDMEKVGVILIQVKNRMTSSNIGLILKESFEPPHTHELRPISKEHIYDSILRANPEMKIVFMLFDFGVDSSSVEVKKSRATEPTVWGLHSKGHDAKVFGCLDGMSVGPCIPRFFRGDLRKQFLSHRRCDPLHNVLHLDTVSQDVPSESSSSGSSEDVTMSGI